MVTTSSSFGAPVVERPEPEAPEVPDGLTRVTMLVQITGTRNGQDWPPIGGEIELPAAEAADLIRQHNAKPAPEPVERAVVEETTERAVVDAPSERAVDEQPAEQAVISRAHSARPRRSGRSKGN